MPRDGLSLSEARRAALAAQGFNRPRPSGRVDARHIRRTILQLGVLQLDYVNVLTPAHYLVLFSRLGPYQPSRLDEAVYRRREFTEQWAHEASIVPAELWPLLRHRRECWRVRPWGFEKFLAQNTGFVNLVLEQVRRQGPLTAEDLPEPPSRPPGMSDSWGWARGVRRQVLEAHFGFGRLAVADRRPNFQRVYDLAERVIPPVHYQRRVTRAESERELLLRAARAQGVAAASDLADYFRMPLQDVRPRLDELVEAGALLRVAVEGWREPAYLNPGAQIPRRIEAASLLSPFDPVVWTRTRVKRLFGFDYRLEIFVPAPKRQWGYYVLPFLLGERLAARVDLKARRKEGQLEVLSAYLEPHAHPERTAHTLSRELRSLASWLGLASVRVRRGGDFSEVLGQAPAS